MEAAGAPPHDVVLVSPGTLPKTSSGKLQRSLCRAQYLDNALQPA
jgi:acyl-CoA synthetase (AMP-forming)/AMP-acid ligase II